MLKFGIMHRKTFVVIFMSIGLVLNASALQASAPNIINSCNDVLACGTGDNSKQLMSAYQNNQKAYECYNKSGDTEMAKIASFSMTRCLTMYGSINPTIRNN